MKNKAAPLETFDVTFTDVHGGEPNFGWCARYTVAAKTAKQALRKAKFIRYGKGNLPRHRLTLVNHDEIHALLANGTIIAMVE